MVNAAGGREQVPEGAALRRLRGRRSRGLVALTLAAVAAIVIVRPTDGALLRDGLEEIASSPDLLALFIGGYAATFMLRAFAWRALVRGSDGGAGSGRLFAILHAALLANHVLPIKAGEVLAWLGRSGTWLWTITAIRQLTVEREPIAEVTVCVSEFG